jgi:hypothetical protein
MFMCTTLSAEYVYMFIYIYYIYILHNIYIYMLNIVEYLHWNGGTDCAHDRLRTLLAAFQHLDLRTSAAL